MNKKVINRFDPFMPVKISNGNQTVLDSDFDETANDFSGFTAINDRLKMNTPSVKKGFTVLFTKKEIGDKGILGEKLLEDFIFSLAAGVELPQYVIFMNEAVYLFSNKNIYENILKMKKYGVIFLASMESMEQLKFETKIKDIVQAASADISDKLLFSEKIISF